MFLENVTGFFHKHPIESVLLGGVAIIALYVAFKPSGASNQASQEAALQANYFNAESIQAQSNAAVQVADITTSATTAQTQIAANTSTANATTYANEAMEINDSNNNSAVAALPFASEDNLISALYGVSQQTSTTTSKSNGFFGIGGSNKTTTAPTTAANSASSYLDELVNELYPAH